MLTLVLLKEEEIEQAREFAFAQILLDKGKASEAWSTYQEIARPYIKTADTAERKEMIQRLLEEVKRGVLKVQPLWEKPAHSRTRTQEARQASADLVDGVYGRFGPIIRKPQ